MELLMVHNAHARSFRPLELY